MFQLPIFHILWNLQGPTCWRDAYFTSKITLTFIHNLYDLVFWLKYFIYYMFQILHFTFLHLNLSFICENLHHHLFVIRYSITLLAHFIYEYIFTLLITFYLWIYYRWIFSSNKTLYTFPQHHIATKPESVAPIFTTLEKLTKFLFTKVNQAKQWWSWYHKKLNRGEL